MLGKSTATTLCLLALAISAQIDSARATGDTDDENERKFQEYLARHGKSYTDAQEYQMRMQLWLETENFVNEANQANASF